MIILDGKCIEYLNPFSLLDWKNSFIFIHADKEVWDSTQRRQKTRPPLGAAYWLIFDFMTVCELDWNDIDKELHMIQLLLLYDTGYAHNSVILTVSDSSSSLWVFVYSFPQLDRQELEYHLKCIYYLTFL